MSPMAAAQAAGESENVERAVRVHANGSQGAQGAPLQLPAVLTQRGPRDAL